MPLPICPAPITPNRCMIMSTAFRPGHAMPKRCRCCRQPCTVTTFIQASASKFGRQFGQRLEQIGHQAVIGDLEDRRFLILIDRHDDLAVLHAGEMLDGARNPDSDVELRRDDLAGLADLEVVGHEAGIHRGARGADRGAELVGHRFDKA